VLRTIGRLQSLASAIGNRPSKICRRIIKSSNPTRRESASSLLPWFQMIVPRETTRLRRLPKSCRQEIANNPNNNLSLVYGNMLMSGHCSNRRTTRNSNSSSNWTQVLQLRRQPLRPGLRPNGGRHRQTPCARRIQADRKHPVGPIKHNSNRQGCLRQPCKDLVPKVAQTPASLVLLPGNSLSSSNLLSNPQQYRLIYNNTCKQLPLRTPRSRRPHHSSKVANSSSSSSSLPCVLHQQCQRNHLCFNLTRALRNTSAILPHSLVRR
jgi:hypothetical protein